MLDFSSALYPPTSHLQHRAPGTGGRATDCSSFRFGLCLHGLLRQGINGSSFPNSVTLDFINNPQLNGNSSPGRCFLQGRLSGSSGALRLSLQWSSVGIRWVSPQKSIPRPHLGQERTAESLLALDFSFLMEFFRLSNRMLAHLHCKGKFSQLGFSTDFVIHCMALLPFIIISQASRIWGHHSSSYTADPSLHLQPCLDDTPFPDRSFCSLYFTCMQPTTERVKGGKKTFENIYHLLFFLSRMKISCAFVHVNAELSFCKSRWWQFLNTVIFCR